MSFAAMTPMDMSFHCDYHGLVARLLLALISLTNSRESRYWSALICHATHPCTERVPTNVGLLPFLYLRRDASRDAAPFHFEPQAASLHCQEFGCCLLSCEPANHNHGIMHRPSSQHSTVMTRYCTTQALAQALDYAEEEGEFDDEEGEYDMQP